MKVLELNEPKPTILKLGGSVITDKTGQLAARTQMIDQLADQIKKANTPNLIVVHGGGSFGHPTALKYGIKEGYKEESQKIGFSETHQVMRVLNGLVMDAFVWHEIPAVSISPSSCIMTKNGRIDLFEDTPLKTLIEMNFYPVLFGDSVLDKKIGFTILSGDQLVAELAIRLDAQRVIMGIDEDGLYDSDPKTEKNGTFLEQIKLDELRKLQSKLGKTPVSDVTGGMCGKISELLPVVEKGIQVSIINASRPNLVYKALRGETVKSTIIGKG
jgi:isopentenyl phosphate kinase